jgi:acetyltransferase-like isoleucine patch superfamily enzyme
MIHPSASISEAAIIGDGTRVWNEAQVREGARIGRDCIVAKGAYVDTDVLIGDRVKLGNHASVFKGARLASAVFVGPHSCLLNDKRPRSVTPEGALKRDQDWVVSGVTVKEGASIGGGCTVLPGVTIGQYAMVGAGSVVTRDVPAHGLVVGNPARLIGSVCECGGRLGPAGDCSECGRTHPGQDVVARP